MSLAISIDRCFPFEELFAALRLLIQQLTSLQERQIWSLAFSETFFFGFDPSVSDEVLMEAYLKGEDNAMKALFKRYAPRIKGLALRKGLSREEAKDAVQLTFVHVHQSRADFKTGSALRPWLFTIALNVMRDLGRRYQSQSRLKDAFLLERKEGQGTAIEAEDGATEDSKKRLIGAALAQLSTEQRDVILFHYYEGMSFSEIARVQGCREGAIRGRAHRGYEKLRKLLKGRAQLEKAP